MTPRTFLCEMFWVLLSNSKRSGVPEDSTSPTLGVLGFTPTLGQSGVATELVVTLKAGAAKGERFQPAKPRNFDGARDRKVVDVWLVEMDDYIHAAKVG